ncbi:hypothetical protein ON020_003823 [Proteus mirabilis]|uniref:hypothetical protein n=1 Tax=Xenorhabdus mauleonii TaxID=351675 RepID=UPI00147641A7|nr:hypothetical protein [Xenorhabdus mauleonii]EKT8676453.1 hypothetical protein [Proteus mirabilis]
MADSFFCLRPSGSGVAVSPLTATAAVQGAQARVLRFPIRPPSLSANRRWCSF